MFRRKRNKNLIADMTLENSQEYDRTPNNFKAWTKPYIHSP